MLRVIGDRNEPDCARCDWSPMGNRKTSRTRKTTCYIPQLLDRDSTGWFLYAHTSIRAYMHIHVFLNTYIHPQVQYMYIYIYIYIYIYMWMYMYRYMYVYNILTSYGSGSLARYISRAIDFLNPFSRTSAEFTAVRWRAAPRIRTIIERLHSNATLTRE